MVEFYVTCVRFEFMQFEDIPEVYKPVVKERLKAIGIDVDPQPAQEPVQEPQEPAEPSPEPETDESAPETQN